MDCSQKKMADQQYQQVTPEMLVGNFFVSEPRSLGRDNKIRVVEVKVGNAIFCTFWSLFDPVVVKFMTYSIRISFWLAEEYVAGAYVGFQVKSRRMFALSENREFVKT